MDINLVGEAEEITNSISLKCTYAVKPENFHGIVPKLVVRKGDEVSAGAPLFYSKADERILFVSPVSGQIVEIVRGSKRKVLAIKISSDGKQQFKNFGKQDLERLSSKQVRDHLLVTGCWPFVKQRPFDVIADPDQIPKSIFVSAYATSPLAPNYDYTLSGKEKELQAAVTAMSKLTPGNVHVSVGSNSNSPFIGLSDIELHKLSGPHPVGNVSTQIAQIDPINKGESVWVVAPQDLVVMGELLLTGNFNITRTIALTGSQFKNPSYVSVLAGASIKQIVGKNIDSDNARIICGNVLSGSQVTEEGFLDYYDNQITAIPEGNDYEFFGWNRPVFNKISPSRALTFSWLTPRKKYDLNTNTNGEHRAFVVTGSYEDVFPLDLYPLQFLKACMYRDIDDMENLGGYEVAPEDFALTEFICVSKQPHQKIVREGLDLMKKELG